MEQTPPSDPADLTRFIETRYHATHRAQLAALIPLAEKVQTVHSGDENAPIGLADALMRLQGEMEVHMKKEELILFPAIRRGGMPGIEHPIASMRADHDDHDRDIGEILQITQNITLPAGACRSWAALYDGLGTFIDDLREHIRLENEVLFPQFEPTPPVHG
ncbi:MAG: hemerythrin domain-containing protein [Paracoccaceae bacterium]|nr:hemerythrin domain-containing protein [Paracoccaceae bacterium]